MNQHQGTQCKAQNKQDESFLPESLVKLVLKIAQSFRLKSFDEFSLLDTLQSGLAKYLNALNGQEITETDMIKLIVSIIRVSEKFNNINSEFTKVKLDILFSDLAITNEEFNNQEFAAFKAIDFRIESPIVAETVYDLIQKHLNHFKKLDLLLEMSFDILRIVYTFRTEIYTMLLESTNIKNSYELKKNQNLLASAILVVVVKILHVSNNIYNQAFDAFVNELDYADKSPTHLNQLSAIIFDFVKDEK